MQTKDTGFDRQVSGFRLMRQPGDAKPVMQTLPYRIDREADDRVRATFYRDGDRYHINLPSLAAYSFDSGSTDVFYWPESGISDAVVDQLFLNQIAPLIRSLSGELVLHVSALEIDGSAVLLAGPTGMGKSTLAAFLATQGFRILSDDGIAVTQSATGFEVKAEKKPIRLWQDSFAALFPDQGYADTDGAKQFAGEKEGLRFQTEPRPLATILFLVGGAQDAGIGQRRLSPREAMQEALKNTFLLDEKRQGAIHNHFQLLASIANGIPQYALSYPRQFDHLPEVSKAIQGLCQTAQENT